MKNNNFTDRINKNTMTDFLLMLELCYNSRTVKCLQVSFSLLEDSSSEILKIIATFPFSIFFEIFEFFC